MSVPGTLGGCFLLGRCGASKQKTVRPSNELPGNGGGFVCFCCCCCCCLRVETCCRWTVRLDAEHPLQVCCLAVQVEAQRGRPLCPTAAASPFQEATWISYSNLIHKKSKLPNFFSLCCTKYMWSFLPYVLRLCIPPPSVFSPSSKAVSAHVHGTWCCGIAGSIASAGTSLSTFLPPKVLSFPSHGTSSSVFVQCIRLI